MRPYGEQNLVRIADSPDEFIEAAEYYMTKGDDNGEWLGRVDAFLEGMSWDKTWAQMSELIDHTVDTKQRVSAHSTSGAEERAKSATGVA